MIHLQVLALYPHGVFLNIEGPTEQQSSLSEVVVWVPAWRYALQSRCFSVLLHEVSSEISGLFAERINVSPFGSSQFYSPSRSLLSNGESLECAVQLQGSAY
jgi:hypothetical protein